MSSVSYSSGGSTAYTWDAAGNMTGEGATSFQYDAASRLKTVNNGTTETNGFDGDSQRVKKVEGGVTVFYVRSSVMKQTGFEVGGNGALYRANVYAGSQKLIGQLSPDGQFYWRHESHLGSVQKMTNSGGAVVYRGEYDPHGNVLLETGSTTLNSHKFTGYEKDQSTGLDYANARMFSGSRGRFTKPDPIGLKAGNRRKPQSLNLYTYVGNDPANLVDTGGTCLVYWNQVSETYGYWDTVLCYELEGGPVKLPDPPPPPPSLDVQVNLFTKEKLSPCVIEILKEFFGGAPDYEGISLNHGGFASQIVDFFDQAAITVGKDIYFGSGQYNQSTQSGIVLIAHEIVHTLQYQALGTLQFLQAYYNDTLSGTAKALLDMISSGKIPSQSDINDNMVIEDMAYEIDKIIRGRLAEKYKDRDGNPTDPCPPSSPRDGGGRGSTSSGSRSEGRTSQ
jgi:RHS repeat-associated protein